MDAKPLALIVTCLCAAVAGGCATDPSSRLPTQLATVKNFHCVSPGIYRGAQPDEAGMEALKDLGIKTVVSLRVPEQVVEWEEEAADRLDMGFVSLPLSNYDDPTEADVRTFLKLVTDPTRQPVFIHCRQGQLRTGALVASYRVIEEGWSAEEAYAEAKQLGFDDQYPWYLPLKWFVHNLDRYASRFAPSHGAGAIRPTAALPESLPH